MAYDYSKGAEFIAYDTAAGHVSKIRQVVLLYEGIVKFLQCSKQCLEEKNFQDQYNYANRAGNIIIGLQASLDFDKGGKLSRILEQYYIAMYTRVMALLRDNDPTQYDGIISEFKAMLDAWKQVEEMSEKTDDEEAPQAQNIAAETNNTGGEINNTTISQVLEEAAVAGISLSI